MKVRTRRGFSIQDTLIVLLLLFIAGSAFILYVLMTRRQDAWMKDGAQTNSGPPAAALATGLGNPTSGSIPIAEASQWKVAPFTLIDQDENTFSSASLDGNYWLVDFIFTNCAGPCPTMTREMRKVQKQFQNVENLKFVSISVDPKRDTPERLTEFAREYEADLNTWSFLSGEYETVQIIARDTFRLALMNPMEETPEGVDPELEHTGEIIHSTRMILVNPEQRIINWFTVTTEQGSADLEKALQGIFGDANKGNEG